MVRELFRTDPEQRPSAADLLEQIRRKNPLLNSTRRVKNEATKAFNKSGQNTKSNCYSALYRFDCENLTLLAMSELPDRVQIKQIALSVSHQLVLTVDERVYSWGENDHGQLGHGDRRVRNGPTLIEALRGKGVSRVAAGKHFSLFCAGRGIAMAAGQRQFVGSGAQADADLLRPKIIETLLK
uniref:Protein kinase domain-containing protein n=1 Tax=Globodera pallida TaxID=36090 RepID=A0A183CST7_GLOPA